MCLKMKLHVKLDLFSVTLGDITESNTYTVNLIIFLGVKFIFKASGAESLNMYRFKGFLEHQFILEGYCTKNKDSLNIWAKFIEADGW